MAYRRTIKNYSSYKRKSRLWVPIIFIVIFLAVIFFPKPSQDTDSVSSESTQIVEINKTSLLTIIKEKILGTESKDETELLGEINEYLETTPGTYGLYVHELGTDKSFGINEEMSFPAASTVKIPLLMSLYKDIYEGKVSKDTVMTYTINDEETGTGSIQYTSFGTRWTVSEIAKRMMKQSDNVAKNMIFRLVGYRRAQEYITGLGVKGVDMSLENKTTSKDSGTLLKLIYENKTVDKELSDEMLELMVKTDFEKRLPRYLEGVKVSHKIGTWAGAISDTGIVFLEGRPYTISVYSEGIQSVDEAEKVIGTISKKVYDYEKSKKKGKFGF